jgi:hypothetical protein
VVACALVVLSAPPASGAAQQLRLRGTTTMRYAQLRPIRYDTAADSFVVQPRAAAAPITQDLELSAWGFGVTGLRAYALLRGRGALGSELVWPRSDDHFDALYAFLELERPRWRVRAGRQQRFSGLGFYGFDGVTGTLRPRPTLRLEAYGGRGMARGFLEPLSSADIRALDPLRPDVGTVLLGTSLWAAPTPGTAITGVYQREILSDWSGIVSERAAVDFQAALGARLFVTGSADADLAAGALGRMRGAVMWRLPSRGYLELEAFRYRPVFDLTTIWGVFSPEGYSGLGATLSLGAAADLAIRSAVSYRRYGESSSAFAQDLADHATELTAGARWRRDAWSVDGDYRLHTGFGGAQSGGDVAVAWARPDAWRIAVKGTAFQQVEDFRVGEGTVIGVGLEARGPLFARPRRRRRSRLVANARAGVVRVDARSQP